MFKLSRFLPIEFTGFTTAQFTRMKSPADLNSTKKVIGIECYSQELPSRIEMESCIQQWTQQLSPMLETDESALQLERPSLTEEIAYWKNRSEDLENIFEQLKQGVVRQMAATLEAIGSAQSAVFKTLLRRVIGALAEAQEIALHMKPIVKPLDALNAADVSEMVEPLRYFDPAIWPVLTAGTKLLTLSKTFILDYYLITFCDTYGNNLKPNNRRRRW